MCQFYDDSSKSLLHIGTYECLNRSSEFVFSMKTQIVKFLTESFIDLQRYKTRETLRLDLLNNLMNSPKNYDTEHIIKILNAFGLQDDQV